jgi:hypothetical protein
MIEQYATLLALAFLALIVYGIWIVRRGLGGGKWRSIKGMLALTFVAAMVSYYVCFSLIPNWQGFSKFLSIAVNP